MTMVPTRRSPRLLLSLLVLASGVPAFAVGSGNDLLPDIPQGSRVVTLEVIADIGPSVVADITHTGDGTGRLFLVSPDGVIRIFSGGAVLATPFLDAPASPTDRAMSGLAFHPEYASNGKLYVITGEAIPNGSTPHFLPPQTDDVSAFDNVLYEYTVDPGNPDLADPASRRELMRVRQPQRFHNMDDLAFGHDGYLYIAMGDGGDTRTGSPTHYNTTGQQTDNPYGTVLRIDVDTTGANGRYGIPADNPFAGGTTADLPEIYAWGLRNPWRISVDRLTGEVFVGVNGDFTIEQVYRVESGRNYGWDVREGSFLWNPANGNAFVDPAPDPQYTPPLAEYDHNGTTQAWGSVIGGFVYRGSGIPALYGSYVFLDWVAAELVAMDPETGAIEVVQIDGGGAQLQASNDITFGEDEDGELYIGRGSGEVLRFVTSVPPDAAGAAPDGDAPPGTPLTVDRAGTGQLRLDWGASCAVDDDDYAVYTGPIGSFGDHQPSACSTGGATTLTLPEAGGSVYYLVVPVQGVREGTYGSATDGPRPPSSAPCYLQSVESCD